MRTGRQVEERDPGRQVEERDPVPTVAERQATSITTSEVVVR